MHRNNHCGTDPYVSVPDFTDGQRQYIQKPALLQTSTLQRINQLSWNNAAQELRR